MKKNKKILCYIFFVILIALLSFLIELFLHRNELKTNKKYIPEIIEMHDIVERDGKYVTTSRKSYIVIDVSSSNYISRLKFDYQIDRDTSFLWDVVADNDMVLHQKSSNVIDFASRSLNVNTNALKILIKSKDVKFNNVVIDNTLSINYSRIIFLFLFMLSFGILIRCRRYFYDNLDKCFIFISVIVGILFFLTTPKVVGSSLDDNTHLKNSIAFFNSNSFKTKQAYLISQSQKTVSLDQFASRDERSKLYNLINSSSKDIEVDLNDYSSKYNKLIYLPFKIGFIIGSIINLPFLYCCLLARIMNYLAYVLLFFFAIKASDNFKRVVFAIGLSTSSLYLGTQFSYDPTIIASLTFAFVLYVKMIEEEKMNINNFILFILLIIWGSLPKAIYAPLLLLGLFIPNQKFASKKQALLLKLLLLFILLLMLSTFVLPMLLGTVGADIRGGNVSALRQFKYILHNPFRYARTLVDFNVTSLLDCQFLLGLFMFICNLQSVIAPKANCLFVIYTVFVLYTVFTSKKLKSKFNTMQNLIIILIILMFLALIPTTMYLAYTSVGNPVILGVQTRYYIPILLPILFLIIPTYNKMSNLENPIYDKLIIFIPYLINMYVLYSLAAYSVGF